MFQFCSSVISSDENWPRISCRVNQISFGFQLLVCAGAGGFEESDSDSVFRNQPAEDRETGPSQKSGIWSKYTSPNSNQNIDGYRCWIRNLFILFPSVHRLSSHQWRHIRFSQDGRTGEQTGSTDEWRRATQGVNSVLCVLMLTCQCYMSFFSDLYENTNISYCGSKETNVRSGLFKVWVLMDVYYFHRCCSFI